MESQSKREIVIPEDVHIAWERNFSFFGTFLLAEQHMVALSAILDITDYSMCAFFHQRGQVQFFRSRAEEEAEARTLAMKCLEQNGFIDFIVKKLVAYSDSVDGFLAKEKKFNANNIKIFFTLLDKHFAFHHAVYWSADYLGSHYQGTKSKKIMEQLRRTRTYNERILPRVEQWLLNYNPDCLLMTRRECVEYVAHGTHLSSTERSAREEAAFTYFYPSDFILLTGKAAHEQQERFYRKFINQYNTSRREINGTPAFAGVYRGTARVVERFEDFKKLQNGDILVTTMTIPEYNQYIRKAGAIVTNEGALLSHAAILAREFKIPCIIGTKIASRVFKDGDRIEVDAMKGIVKKLG